MSFNVEFLFTQVPIEDTLDIIKSSYEIPSSLIPLIEKKPKNYCLTTTYFFYNDQFYEQGQL